MNPAGDLPQWAQMAIWIATTVVTIAVIIRQGWKKSEKENTPSGTATVLAGAFADKRALEALTDELIDLRRSSGELRSDLHRDITILVTDIRENTRTTRLLIEAVSEFTKVSKKPDSSFD